MKKSTATLQILTGMAAAAAAWAFMPRTPRREQVVVITGGSRGLGLAIAERFGRAGAKLVLAAREIEELTRARHLLLERQAVLSPDDVLLIPADLTDPTQATRLINHAIQHFGRIDVLINNAGIIEVGPVENQPLVAYRRAMATNFFAALHTTHAVLPHMLERNAEADTSRPAIVNIASIGGKLAMPHMLPYTASKFALVGFSEGLHAELRHKGVRVTTVCPGLMRTGSHVQASFVGNQEKEYRWFSLAATTPIISASTQHAANRIFDAVINGRTEITITPQAWLAARFHGLAPATTQYVASLINEFLLPAPTSTEQLTLGFNPRKSSSNRSRTLEDQNNQQPASPYAPDPNQTTFTFKHAKEEEDSIPCPIPENQPLM
jgi:NAD(P)-dependent dehydrogenase (short-subunit alcohol dehydrogenase family)